MRRTVLQSCLRWMLAVLVLTLGVSCRRDHAIAKLETTQGNVLRTEANKDNTWNAANVGALFAIGDALRTSHGAEAILGMDDGSKLRVRQDTLIRFLNRRPSRGSQAFDVETGEVLLEAGQNGLSLTTSIGTARVEPNARVVIRRSVDGVYFDVTVGSAHIETSDGQHEVGVGQSYFVSVGNAVVENEVGDGGTAAASAPQRLDTSLVGTRDAAVGVPVKVTGSGVSQRPPLEQAFQPVAPGTTHLHPGATVRVESGSSVELNRDGASLSLAGAGSYNVGDADAPIVVQSGSVSVAGATRIIVPGGVIETVDKTHASLETLGKDRTRVRVATGWASVTGSAGSTKVSAGEQATLNGDGSTKLEGKSLTYSDVSIDVGESVVLHDPQPPTAVRFAFASRCPAGGIVRVRSKTGGQFGSGHGSAALALGPGRHDYQLHCLGESGTSDTVEAHGAVTVQKDAGTRPVPTTPPSTSVSLDGRTYTVMYQNQLPRVTVTWPNAPASSSYSLHVESRKGAKTLTTASPSFVFASGALAEGHHTIHFDGGGKVSRHTGVEIAFDNAAPMASLTTPAKLDVGLGGEITIAGVAQPGWTVEVGGIKVAQDAKQRFSQGMQMPTTERALTVKLTHPTRGTHVYLRRAARGHE